MIEANVRVYPNNPTKNVLWVSPQVYECIEKNQDGIIIETQCRPPLVVKVIGKGK